MKQLFRLLLLACIFPAILLPLALCSRRSNPYEDTSNARVNILLPAEPDTGYLVSDSISIGIELILANLVDSISITQGNAWDTTIVTVTTQERDTVQVSMPLVVTGNDTLTVVIYLEDRSMREASVVITVILTRFVRQKPLKKPKEKKNLMKPPSLFSTG